MSDENVLDLGLSRERQKAHLPVNGTKDGEIVELAEPDDFNMIELRKLFKLRDEHNRLAELAKLTKAQEKRLATIRDRMVRMLILGGPDVAVSDMADFKKAQVIGRFFVRAELTTATFVGEETISQTESLLRASSASTAATPSGGST